MIVKYNFNAKTQNYEYELRNTYTVSQLVNKDLADSEIVNKDLADDNFHQEIANRMVKEFNKKFHKTDKLENLHEIKQLIKAYIPNESERKNAVSLIDEILEMYDDEVIQVLEEDLWRKENA